MNEQKVVRIRRCPRCQQLVKANAFGMWQHGVRCLRFDWRDSLVREMAARLGYHPPVEAVAPADPDTGVIHRSGFHPRRGQRGRHR